MKKFLVLFIIAAYFFSTTELVQLLKVPVLINHFVEHTEEDDGMTFMDYIVHHYGGHEKDADWETDMKLPFMQHSDLLNILVIPAENLNLPDKITFDTHFKTIVFYSQGTIPNYYLSSIWQPPKYC
ncbi:hypothetical protein [Paenimyroides baculatum]|uniref:Uncharacterized protein n=1 Tax=Paenimyroides baculatum TaxID=2608000 RepID=A0A5M6C906_9FLAO|nr:hypothetical protein [Paenimyroides baculatum]KAA5531646.1 hypothetical protein F0460_15780 [Paenimyroides baculatum]